MSVGTAGLWALLIGGILLLLILVLLALALLGERSTDPTTDPAAELAELRAEAPELAEHATVAQAGAARALESADRARNRALAAEAARDEAWSTQEAAEQAYQLAQRAALDGRLPSSPLVAGGADRERMVTQAALGAYRRGDISARQLRALWSRARGLDPAQEQREQLAERRHADLAEARREHDRRAAVARRAEEEAQVAEVAAQALLDEAAASAAEAEQAKLAVAQRPPRRLRWPRAKDQR